MRVLVDSSVWIAYFRGEAAPGMLDLLIEEDLLATNDLILAELVPALWVRGERRLVELLQEIQRVPLSVDWSGIVDLQVTCLRNGINKVGIPDLVIAQDAMRNGYALLSLDKHFKLLGKHVPLVLCSRTD